MPHIKSIRLVNVHFNNATQFYDDFRMELGGHNTTYDLENGGGKSLLLLMILQTVLPKSHLRREKPLSLLFQGGKDRTSHVAVEWILEEGSNYKYLLTGFSARKRKGAAEAAGKDTAEEEENLQAADIEHLNWCVFYNDHRIAGIKAVPLLAEEAGKKSYAGFDDIRKYLQQLKQKGLPTQVFDKIDQYQSYIAAHNLLSAEWNIIKGINSGENNIESYFRQNPTSRKLIENQFIKIVEDVEALNNGAITTDDSFLLADTLIEIRNRLNEYLRLKGHMTEYEKIKDYYEEYGRKNMDFLQAYQNYEACKLLAAAIRNLLDKQLKTLEQTKIATQAQWEYNKTGSIEGHQLKRLLDAGLVNHKKEKLYAIHLHLEKESNLLATQQSEIETQLNHLLTLEGYGEYRRVKGKVTEIRQRLQTLEKDEDSLQTDYREAGGKFRFLIDKRSGELEDMETKAEQTKDGLEKESARTNQDLITFEKQASVQEEKITALLQQEVELQKKQKGLNEFFLQNGEMNAILAPEQLESRLEEELNRHLSEHAFTSENIDSLNNALQNLRIETVQIEGEINRKLDTQKPLENWLEDYRLELSDLQKKAAVFGKSTIKEYQEGLDLLIHKQRLTKLEMEIEAGRIQQKKQLSEDRGYYVPNEEILSLADKLSSQCEFVQAGIDWMAKAEPEEKESILHQMPYLPFSVIIDRVSFEKLKNGRLKLDFSSDYPVPVVNLETIRLFKDNHNEDIYYFCSFAGLILDSVRYEQYIHNIETTLQALDRKIMSTDTIIAELNRDSTLAAVFYGKYPHSELENKQTALNAILHQLKTLREQLGKLQEKEESFIEENNRLAERLAELAKLTAIVREKIEKLIDSREKRKALTAVREQLAEKRQELEDAKENIHRIMAAAAKLKQQAESLENQLKLLMLELHDVRKDKDRLAGFTAIETYQAIAAVRAGYKALQEAVSGRNAEEDELRSDLEDNETRLNALKNRILREYAEDLEEIEKNEENTLQIIIPTQDMIKEARQHKDENSRQLEEANKKLTVNNLAINKIEGKLEEILKGSGQDPETVLPHYYSESRYQQEIEQAGQLIKSYQEEMDKAGEALERIKEEYGKLHNQKEDYEAFLEREEVKGNEAIAPEAKEYRQFETEYRRLQDIIRQQSEKWDNRIKAIQAETVQFVIHEPLEELAKISKPLSAAQCQNRNEAFAEYIANLEEQMQKIDRDILQLESYQEDFSRRCIQRAELVLGHLRKLEALSRIEVYGRRTNMIELRLQEFEEKDKQLRMKRHIDGIVREIGEDGAVDRKRVAARLSTKELLAQISDMEKAAVRLYKIEGIPENSRFYRWEQAIGSEGQNNSLYFIFAACLISFIRMLSITNISVRTKKVIIADNPFGATSAVYLWDPMFKIMKQNDIQLIAPGHRIPREITSRFSVSYLLNQDIFQDGRMRVVVKDVRVEEDEEVFRYVDTEQMSLF